MIAVGNNQYQIIDKYRKSIRVNHKIPCNYLFLSTFSVKIWFLSKTITNASTVCVLTKRITEQEKMRGKSMNARAANLQLQGSSLQRKAIKVMTSAFFQVWFNAISSLFVVIFVKYLTNAYTFNSQRRSSYCKLELFCCR